ncbi:MAG TPA: GNAT family N-acetyltransferase [Ktedonobacteraceae bacterium]
MSNQDAPVVIREIRETDRDWLAQFVNEHWGASFVVSRGTMYELALLPGFIAEDQGEPVGVVTYQKEGQACEVVSIDSLRPNKGIGTLLLNAVKDEALRAGCTRLWLITTNDNLNALRFYQKWGMTLVAIHRNAIEQSLKLKPQIPLIGEHGIPLRDEIELEQILSNFGEKRFYEHI